MKSAISIEVGEDEIAARCSCCGEPGSTGHGFIYRDGSAHGVYYAAWSRAHPERGVSLAIAVGEWDDGSTTADRTCVGLEVSESEEEILFRFTGPDRSPWPSTELLGPMLTREAALMHPLKPEFLELGEVIVHQHPSLAAFFHLAER